MKIKFLILGGIFCFITGGVIVNIPEIAGGPRGLSLRRIQYQYAPHVNEWLERLTSSDEETVVRALTEIARSQYSLPNVPNPTAVSSTEATVLVKKILPLFHSDKEGIRGEAIFAVATMARFVDSDLQGKILTEMCRLLKEDESESVRLSSIQGLYRLFTEGSLGENQQKALDVGLALVEALGDPSELVSAYAGDALHNLIQQVKSPIRDQIIDAVFKAAQEGRVNPSNYARFMRDKLLRELMSPRLREAISSFGPGKVSSLSYLFLVEENPIARSIALRDIADIWRHHVERSLRKEALFTLGHILYKGMETGRKDLLSRTDVEFLISLGEEILSAKSIDSLFEGLTDDRSSYGENIASYHYEATSMLCDLTFYLQEDDEDLRMKLAEKFVQLLNHPSGDVRGGAIIGLSRVLLGGYVHEGQVVDKGISRLSSEDAKKIVEEIKKVLSSPSTTLTRDEYRRLNEIIQALSQK